MFDYLGIETKLTLLLKDDGKEKDVQKDGNLLFREMLLLVRNAIVVFQVESISRTNVSMRISNWEDKKSYGPNGRCYER